jgi:hypothetical protein
LDEDIGLWNPVLPNKAITKNATPFRGNGDNPIKAYVSDFASSRIDRQTLYNFSSSLRIEIVNDPLLAVFILSVTNIEVRDLAKDPGCAHVASMSKSVQND